ncbi:hypothetical protein [Halalkalibacterium ligniniphilum]|nr:hypothetical protein [Halalkalibacterium ligniniphilum]
MTNKKPLSVPYPSDEDIKKQISIIAKHWAAINQNITILSVT